MNDRNHTRPRCVPEIVRPFLMITLGVWICGGTALLWACNIPVFQYAMAYWEPDPFPVVVLHRGSLSQEQQAEIDWLERKATDPESPANLGVILVNLDEPIPELVQPLLAGMREPDTLPWVHVGYPASSRLPQPAFTGPWQSGMAAALVESPARREILDRLAQGDAAVWVMLTSSDPEADAKAESLIREELPRVTERLISTGQVAGGDAVAGEETVSKGSGQPGASGLLLGEAPAVELDLPDVPLQFSVLKIDRNDPAEQPFVSMLLNSESDLVEFDSPIVMPVFGRGRSYYALVAGGITPDNLFELSAFLVGSCSCEVKAENPGTDLLFAANWSEMVRLTPEEDRPLPALTGLGAFESSELLSARSQTKELTAPISGSISSSISSSNSSNGDLGAGESRKSGAGEGTNGTDLSVRLRGDPVAEGAEAAGATAGGQSRSRGFPLRLTLLGVVLVLVALVAIGTVSIARRPAI